MPPTGGFGGNTGIHDAHNLAWKLALVVRGQAGVGLLDSYDTERRFIAEATLAQALARLAAWFQDPSKRLPPPVPLVEDTAVILGQCYPSGALIEEPDAPAQAFEDPRHPSGRPGSRASHIVIEQGGTRGSIHDRFGAGFVLLAGSEGRAWSDAAAAAGLPAIRVGADVADVEHRFTSAYGVRPEGAVLVRPDGVIAWRSPGSVADPGSTLRSVLDRILARSA
jgi:hypothetical protein